MYTTVKMYGWMDTVDGMNTWTITQVHHRLFNVQYNMYTTHIIYTIRTHECMTDCLLTALWLLR